jgi:hypothetical protein
MMTTIPKRGKCPSGCSPVPLKAGPSLTSGTVLPRLAGIFQLS